MAQHNDKPKPFKWTKTAEDKGHRPTTTGVMLLLLAWQKARIILAWYLGLTSSPTWQRGFSLASGALCLAILGLHLAALFQWSADLEYRGSNRWRLCADRPVPAGLHQRAIPKSRSKFVL